MSNQFPIIQVTQEDYELSQEETMGSKSKFWFKHSQLGNCLYKHIRPNTGEDWAEKIASELCQLLQLPHARYELAETWEKSYGTISVNFLPEGGALIHGNEILTSLIPNYPTFSTYNVSEHNLDIVFQAIENNQVILPPNEQTNVKLPNKIETATDLFVGYLLLDSWIGNGDRHHENWGFVRWKNLLYLAPTYDHASCLGRELSDQKRKVRSVEAYAKKCLSAFYKNINNQKPLKTFEVFSEVANLYPHAANIWLNCLKNISIQDIDLIFHSFPKGRISSIAAKFAKDILIFNQTRLLSLKK